MNEYRYCVPDPEGTARKKWAAEFDALVEQKCKQVNEDITVAIRHVPYFAAEIKKLTRVYAEPLDMTKESHAWGVLRLIGLVNELTNRIAECGGEGCLMCRRAKPSEPVDPRPWVGLDTK